MISLILPYWRRQLAADLALRQLAATYPGTDMEVIVVDDGDPFPFIAPAVDLDLRVIRLPQKNVPLSPGVPWNAGVRASRGEIIVISCVEILHLETVIDALADEVVRGGPDTYAMAAAWCPEQARWHCHSTVEVPLCPPGYGLPFCAALTRDLFERAGGFDEAYRAGAGYEDNDFIWRLHRIGARPVKRDDLVVTHPKSGATTRWPAQSFARNKRIFTDKWIRH